jgi:hypothetical protein
VVEELVGLHQGADAAIAHEAVPPGKRCLRIPSEPALRLSAGASANRIPAPPHPEPRR